LASLRAGQERELLTLGLETKKDMWRDADWQIEALQKTKAVSQTNHRYYTDLKNHGLVEGESAYQDLTDVSTVLRGAGNVVEAVGGAMAAAGNYFYGVAGFGGTPLIYSQLPIGEPLAFDFASAARVMVALADIANTTAGLQLTEGGWERRLVEWNHQIDILTIEIQQIERQILGAQRRRDQMLQDLNSHSRQMEQSRDVQDFLRDKFTAHDLYLYLQKETSALYGKTYDLALYAARQAEHAFNLERGHTTRHFLPECAWDDLHEGLMAGERLSAALRQMEKAYLDENVREYELTKQFSLRLHFPIEFLRLRATGRCEIDIPEWMFDLDFPGHYMRRIKNVTLTIPCVTGPYTGVHCRLTLLRSMTRIDPRRDAPVHECCCPPEPCCSECSDDERLAREYQLCPDDPRIVRQYGAHEAIATSTAQNDSGLFELNFNDQKYLPFEYMGAVSRWRIELPPENNYFEMRSLTDTIVRLNYTAREGGEPLRRAASAAAQRHLPGDGWCFLDLRHEFPDAWQLFKDCSRDERSKGRLRLRLHRKMFPFVPGAREIWIDRVAILLGTDEYEDCNCPKSEGCPCPEPGEPARQIIEFVHGDEECDCEPKILCRASEEWPDLYCGIFNTHIGPLGGKGHHAEVELRFHAATMEIEQIYLLCHYMIRSCAEAGRGRNDSSAEMTSGGLGQHMINFRGLSRGG
jgi:Tc toxin complex TcA C-terminal TcB-binding domain